MPGRRFTKKEDRQVAHIAASERSRGVDPKDAKSIAYGTLVNQKKGKK